MHDRIESKKVITKASRLNGNAATQWLKQSSLTRSIGSAEESTIFHYEAPVIHVNISIQMQVNLSNVNYGIKL